ncbi:MAG: hypothetical protein LQ338_007579 [Usnochroma carphineum]|nr:MAG: hypothetical protein LQ338_007579 [Usnochroma carphineum]
MYGRPIDENKEIAITSGATAAILSSLMAFVEAGDEVIVIEPLFNLYGQGPTDLVDRRVHWLIVQFVGGTVRSVTLHPPAEAGTMPTSADSWVLDMDELRDAVGPRTKMLIINTPYSSQLANETFPRIATLGAAIAARTISIGSVGKTFNATGWRVGYAIGPENLITYVQWAHVLLSYVASGPAQEAAAVAYEEAEAQGFWNSNKQLFKRKVDSLCLFLDELGLPYVIPSGAYFIFVNISQVELPRHFDFPPTVAKKGRDWKVCYYMCRELGVSSIPGSAFFLEQNSGIGADYVRFVVCKTDEEIEFAKERLRGLKPLIRTHEAIKPDI